MNAVGDSRLPTAAYAAQIIEVQGSDDHLSALLQSESLRLHPQELRAIAAAIGRDPTRAEAHAFAIQWSEHCSYKSSRALLGRLPTHSADVIVPVGEDAGVLRLAAIDGVEYGAAVAHESHNHPSQVVPLEGAATGIGGVLRDVLCMGAEIVASADPLRFGTPEPGSHAAYVAASAVEGIAAYGNAVGVPNIAGDVFFHPSFCDNCLVNVVALGIVRTDRIVHSRVPPDGVGFDLILVGKATDASGFGGAAFASLGLDAANADANKSAVQVPDPFLKNVLMRATYAVLETAFAQGVSVGLKDLGAGGIMGSTSELCSAGGYGALVDLDAVPQAIKDLPAFVVACAETQERMLWAVPPQFSNVVLETYNERFTLGDISRDARASVIGHVTAAKQYRLRTRGQLVADVPIDVLTGSVRSPRVAAPRSPERDEVVPIAVDDVAATLLRVLAHPDVCSRRPLIEHYDTVVRGATVIPSGYADAGVIILKRGFTAGIALSVDGNPRYGRLSAKMAASHAVVEAARNVAAVGALPIGLTDCLNYGSPEDPVSYRALIDGIDGLAEAAYALRLGTGDDPLPFVSGNVSLYNESAGGTSIVPSAIVACIGRVDDIGRVVTMRLTAADNRLLLLGPRTAHLGGSVLAALAQTDAGALPPLDYREATGTIKAVIDAIRTGLVSAAHDVSDGGLLACVAEMCLGGDGDGAIGAHLFEPYEWAPWLAPAPALFGEAGGIVVEVAPENVIGFQAVCEAEGADSIELGMTGGGDLSVGDSCDVPLARLREAWLSPLRELYA
ncbi:MAG: phosphoribosylformylglycinamidine synthase subunit PurL [Candidatus Eremiobacteraeota bacterium]|nr:phosphoribosylformylglycinamidine synthase subunit PurL [Candidatus Eremiobacteraeota bacterium]